MTYTKLSLEQVIEGIHRVADDAEQTYGRLDQHKLNWKPDDKQWSVAQCFDHLIRANDLLVAQAKVALAGAPMSLWQRLPLWPELLGRVMVRSQAPRKPSSKKYTADRTAAPPSRIPPDVIERFVEQHRGLEVWIRTLDEDVARRTILISPFVSFITYSVLDGLRLIVAHDRRHFEQAHRVLKASPR